MRALCIFVAHSQPTVSIAKTDFYVHPHWEIADALDDKGNQSAEGEANYHLLPLRDPQSEDEAEIVVVEDTYHHHHHTKQQPS